MESIQYTDYCLTTLTEDVGDIYCSLIRMQKYTSQIYNHPEWISCEASTFLNLNPNNMLDDDTFWALYQQPIHSQLSEQNKLTIHFLSNYYKMVTNTNYKKYHLQQYLVLIKQKLNKCHNELFKSGNLFDHRNAKFEVVLRRLLRMSNCNQNCYGNDGLEIGEELIFEQYNEIVELMGCIQFNECEQRLKQLVDQYVIVLLSMLRDCLCRVTQKQYKDQLLTESSLYNVQTLINKLSQQTDNPKCQSLCEQIIRVLFLKNDQITHNYHQYHANYENIYKIQKLIILDNDSTRAKQDLQHLQAIQRIISYHCSLQPKEQELQVLVRNMKREHIIYFFKQQSELTVMEMNDEELLKHLKKLLNPPYQYGICTLVKKYLRLIENREFSNILVKIFNQSQQLYEEDEEPSKCDLKDLQQTIIDKIWASGCDLTTNFYTLIDSSLIGLKLCLRTRTIGLEGAQILCNKFHDSDYRRKHLSVLAEIAHLNLQTQKEWQLFHSHKIVTNIINRKFKKYSGENRQQAASLANLIGSSSKCKPVQEEYTLQESLYANLQKYAQQNDLATVCSTLYGLSGLVYANKSNQQILGKPNKLKNYLQLLVSYSTSSSLIFGKVCRLLANLIYMNQQLIPHYISLNIHQQLSRTFNQDYLLSAIYNYDCFKQFLRLMANMALTLLTTEFVDYFEGLVAAADGNNHHDLVKYGFQIIFYVLNYPYIEIKNVALRVHEARHQDCIRRYVNKNVNNVELVCCGLEALEKVYQLQIAAIDAVKSPNNTIITDLENIASLHCYNQKILGRWLRLAHCLSRPESIATILSSSQLLLRASILLKNNSDSDRVETETLSICMQLIDIYYLKEQMDRFVDSGLIDLITEVLKVKQLKSNMVLTLINKILQCHAQRIFNPQNYLKIFEGIMFRLSIDYIDENTNKWILCLLVAIRDRILMNTRSAKILLKFGYMFLTQKEIMLSSKYQKRVREFICLLSYFIAFNVELKPIFKQSDFIEILESWIKIDECIDQDNSVSEACRVCIFIMLNQQRFLRNLTPQQLQNKEQSYTNLLTPHKCLLYRRNHTNKHALVKLTKNKSNGNMGHYELVAYKAPNGQIKEKYTLPVEQIIGYREYESSEEEVYRKSVFGVTGRFYQKSAVEDLCVTIIAISGKELSIRQLDLEFIDKKKKQTFTQNFKVMVSCEFKDKRSSF